MISATVTEHTHTQLQCTHMCTIQTENAAHKSLTHDSCQ